MLLLLFVTIVIVDETIYCQPKCTAISPAKIFGFLFDRVLSVIKKKRKRNHRQPQIVFIYSLLRVACALCTAARPKLNGKQLRRATEMAVEVSKRNVFGTNFSIKINNFMQWMSETGNRTVGANAWTNWERRQRQRRRRKKNGTVGRVQLDGPQ